VKAFFRSPTVQRVLTAILVAYLRLTYRTLRWTKIDEGLAEVVWDAGGPVVTCFWHSRILISPPCWPLERAQEPRALISLSKDGEFIARAVDQIGFPAIRGSSTKKSAPDKAKGGSDALRDGLRWLKGGGGIAITPDGPRGPAEVMAEGAPVLAQMTNAPVLFMGLACEPAITLGGWDHGKVPLPFARAAVVWGRTDAPRTTPAAELAKSWAVMLSDLTRRAERLAGGRAD
jgi:lysophospholipid acyltransferase (LPLAT)-like uncharacterized protein